MNFRVIPCLLLRHGGLVKTRRFKEPKYVGDPLNAVRIFNEKEVDELTFLDITATIEGRGPAFDIIQGIASECFMPFAYGGGISTIEQIREILALGVEKVVINTAAIRNPSLIREAASVFGSQSIVVSIDVRRKLLGRYTVCSEGGRKDEGIDPVLHAQRMQEYGAGELLVTSIDREGTGDGYDVDCIMKIASSVSIPIIANGGASELEHFRRAIAAGAAAVSAGSFFVFYGKHRAVLITYPKRDDLERLFAQ